MIGTKLSLMSRCIQHHGQVLTSINNDYHQQTGLTESVLNSKLTIEQAQEQLFKFIKKYVPDERVGLLAGNSVHVDRMFLLKEFPLVINVNLMIIIIISICTIEL